MQKGYLLFDLTNKRFFVSRNVTFRETLFPFKDMKTRETAMFPPDPSLITQDATTPTNITDPTLTNTTDPQLKDRIEEQGIGI